MLEKYSVLDIQRALIDNTAKNDSPGRVGIKDRHQARLRIKHTSLLDMPTID